MMRLKKISLLRERVTKWSEYPFNIPAIASLDSLELGSRVCFFVGENGTGKSTLLEAVASHYGFGLEGGNRNFSPHTTASVRSIDPLVGALRLSFTKKTGKRQLSFLVLLHDLVAKNDNIQFLIATHSPILLAYTFDGGEVHQISYRETQPFQL